MPITSKPLSSTSTHALKCKQNGDARGPYKAITVTEMAFRKVEAPTFKHHYVICTKFFWVEVTKLAKREQLDRELQLPECDIDVFESLMDFHKACLLGNRGVMQYDRSTHAQ